MHLVLELGETSLLLPDQVVKSTRHAGDVDVEELTEVIKNLFGPIMAQLDTQSY